MKCLNCAIALDCDNKLLCEDCRNKNITSKDSDFICEFCGGTKLIGINSCSKCQTKEIENKFKEVVLREEDKKCKLCGKKVDIAHLFCSDCERVYDASSLTPPNPTVEELQKTKMAKIEEIDVVDRLVIINFFWMLANTLAGLFILCVMFRGRKK